MIDRNGKIYTYWSGDSIPDYIKRSIEANVVINDLGENSMSFILCYDKNHVPTVGWDNFIERLKKYSNFHLQEINDKDIFNDEEEFLPEQYKRIFHIIQCCSSSYYLLSENIRHAYKKDFVELYVLRNKNTVWLDADVICKKPISLENIRYGYKQAFGNLYSSAAIIISDNNHISNAYAKLGLDIVQLFLDEKSYHESFQLADWLNVANLSTRFATELSNASNHNLDCIVSIIKDYCIFNEDIHVPPSGMSLVTEVNCLTFDVSHLRGVYGSSGQCSMNYSVDDEIFDSKYWRDRYRIYEDELKKFNTLMSELFVTRDVMNKIKQNKSANCYFRAKNNVDESDEQEFFLESTYLRTVLYNLVIDHPELGKRMELALANNPECMLKNIGMKLSEAVEIFRETYTFKKGIFDDENLTTLQNVHIEEKPMSSGKDV